MARNNLSFRIPTPTYGAGLIEAIQDSTILANMNANRSAKSSHNISGHENRNGNDGSDHPIRLEGAEQITGAFRGRGLQRRTGSDE